RLPSLEIRRLSAHHGRGQATYLGALLQFHQEFSFAPLPPPPDRPVARPHAPTGPRRFQTRAWLEFGGGRGGPAPGRSTARKPSSWLLYGSAAGRGRVGLWNRRHA